MKKNLKFEGGFHRIMEIMAALMCLNFLCIICCLPLVTIGPSVTAMCYVAQRLARNQETAVTKDFFYSFKENMRQGIVIHLIMLLVAVVIFLDIYFCRQLGAVDTTSKYLLYLSYFVLFVYLMVFIYVYPLLSKYNNSVKKTFLNALLMSISHLGRTLVMMAVTFVPYYLMYINTVIMKWGILFFLVVGFAVTAYLNAKLLVRIFDRHSQRSTEA